MDATRQSHRVGSCGNHLEPFAEDGFGQHRGCGRAVSCNVVGFAGGLLDKLSAEVFVCVFQIDVFGDCHTVFRDLGRAPAFVQHSIAATRTQRAFDRTGKLRNPGEQRLTGLIVEHHLFGHKKLL